MIHATVFCYIFTILIGVSALTIQWLASKGDKHRTFTVMKPFIIMLLVMNVYDFIIYYSDNIIHHYASGNILVSLGDCLIAILVFLWLRVENDLCESKYCGCCMAITQRYIVAYLTVWVMAVVFFRDLYWIRLIIDLPLICLLIVGSLCSVYEGIRSTGRKALTIYKSIITIFMVINYATYFISESGLMQEVKVNLMNLTIFFWLVINVANTVLLYKRDFYNSYMTAPESSGVMNLNQALELTRSKYELTKREVEILEQIYEGKSNVEIAQTLFISESTVKAHIYNIFRKMKVRSRVEAVCLVRDQREK